MQIRNHERELEFSALVFFALSWFKQTRITDFNSD